jgi:hypothetical protein
MPRWGPAKPNTRIKVTDCGQSVWEGHGLDIPHELETFNFRVAGTGHERIERIFCDCCADRRRLAAMNDKQPEQRIAGWICRNACSFVFFDTKARATVIGVERPDDADAFRREFLVGGKIGAKGIRRDAET